MKPTFTGCRREGNRWTKTSAKANRGRHFGAPARGTSSSRHTGLRRLTLCYKVLSMPTVVPSHTLTPSASEADLGIPTDDDRARVAPVARAILRHAAMLG